VETVDGTTVEVAPRSLCVHGDTPNAARIAARVREALETSGVAIGAFA
ncbi:LamB/YcsF family protein, partial [Streptomyces rochei]|nr:LamB/YcsF family protein [Streptomyces rochei]